MEVSILNFTKTHPAVLELKHAEKQSDNQTQPGVYAFISFYVTYLLDKNL
jgi:hypothetical protein